MPKYRIFAMILSSLMLISCAGNQPAPQNASQTEAKPAPAKLTPAPAPDNRPGDDVMELWGEKVPDPYQWLEDATNEDVKTWIAAQDKRTRDYLAQMPTREQFKKRLTELLYLADVAVNSIRDNYIFYYERRQHEDTFTLYMRDTSNPDNPPKVLIDPNKLSKDGSISLGRISVSPDGKLLAYALNPNNADMATMYIMNVENGETLSDKIDDARWANPAWLKDGSGFYYTYFPADTSVPVNQRAKMSDVRFHKIGTPQSEDIIITEPPFNHISISNDGEWFLSDLRVRRTNSNGEWFKLPDNVNDSEVATIYQNALYLMIDNNAPRYRIIKIDLSAEKPDLTESAWQTIVPEFEDRTIENFAIVQDKLFVVTLKDVVNYLDVYDLNGKWIKSIELPDKGTIYKMSNEIDPNALFVTYTSFKIYKHLYRIDPKSLDMSLWNETQTNTHPEDIIVEQLFTTSKDGTRIPFFVLRHKNTKLDGTAKTILHGYGGLGMLEKPFINLPIFAWLEQGGIYVDSVLRGGGEYGEFWHQDGIGFKKQNSFDDFYAVAEYLIAHKYTRPASLAADGYSNGGLLAGAALTQRPDLFGAVLCGAPLLDMLRYHLFAIGHREEYGNPEASEAEFKNILAYSPYSNVKKTDYPSVLFLSSDSDERVNPLHARKMTAAIQDATTSDNPVLLRIEKNAGHSGTGKVHSTIDREADTFSFLWEVLE